MCYSTLRIENNSRQFDLRKDRVFLNVPCGKCGECRQKRQDEVTARLYYQFLETEKTFVPGFHYFSPDGSVTIHEHGYVYFESFTYNDEMVPWCHGIKCFNPAHYRYFMVNLRNQLKREGFPKGSIKVYWCSEYGGDTFRPHYHALFFVTAPITPEKLEEMLQFNWCEISDRNKATSKRISYGWTDIANPYSLKHTEPYQLVCDSIAVLGYVGQYIGKDIEFEQVLSKQKNSSYDGLPISEEEYKIMKPFTRQSNGIGECIKDCLTIDELMDGRMSIPDKLQGTKSIALPLYIDRKVFYDYNPEDKCFRLTDIGFQMREHRLQHNREYVKKQIDWLSGHISQLWNDFSNDYIADLCKNHQEFSSPAACMMKVSDVLYNRKDDFIDYILYYKDIYSTYRLDVDEGVNLQELAASRLIKYSYSQRCDCCNESLKNIKVDDFDDYRCIIKHTYGHDCNRFKDFDIVIAILNGLNLSYCILKQRQYIKYRAEKARQKKIYKQGLYSSNTFHSLNRF